MNNRTNPIGVDTHEKVDPSPVEFFAEDLRYSKA